MSIRTEWKWLVGIVAVFLAFYFVPATDPRLQKSLVEALALTHDYAREHVILCLVPAFFIAGGIAVFISQGAVMKYLGPKAKKLPAYLVASVSGSILAVCSCTVLPLFAGIYRMGAGLGPATAFLYSGPAINVMAIILTARVLGAEMGLARAIGAVAFSIIIGILMHLIYRKEEHEKSANAVNMPEETNARPLSQTALFFASMIAVMVFATWSASESNNLWTLVYKYKWLLSGASALVLAFIMVKWMGVAFWKTILTAMATATTAILVPQTPELAFSVGIVGASLILATSKGEATDWLTSTWEYAKLIMPLLFVGVLVAGALLGRPGEEGLIPAHWVTAAVGGNSFTSNLLASVVGAFMYFATLTEIPILQGLMSSGMGKGPALALLLAGPALSLPNMLVIRSVMGTQKTIVFTCLVISMATVSGLVYGYFF